MNAALKDSKREQGIAQRMYESYRIKAARDLKRLTVLSGEFVRFIENPKSFTCDEMDTLCDDFFCTASRIQVFEQFRNSPTALVWQRKLIKVYMDFKKQELRGVTYCPGLVDEDSKPEMRAVFAGLLDVCGDLLGLLKGEAQASFDDKVNMTARLQAELEKAQRGEVKL